MLVTLLATVAPISAQTQAAMNAQARADFAQADAELNKTSQAVLAKPDDQRSFSQAVLYDFKELQEAGITHPDIDKVKALLTTNPDRR